MQQEQAELARWVVAHRKKPPTLWKRFEAIIQQHPLMAVLLLFGAAALMQGAMR